MKNNENNQSLLRAIINQQYQIAILMLENVEKIKESDVDRDGNNLLHMIANRTIRNTKNEVLINLILNKTPVEFFNAKNDKGQTPLHLAFSLNNITGANILIKAGAKIDEIGIDKNGNNVFHVIANIENINDDLINKAFNSTPKDLINAKNNLGQTPLFLAFKHSLINLVQKLLDDPAIDHTTLDDNGNNAFHLIGNRTISNEELIKLILKKTPNDLINTKNNEGQSPLQLTFTENNGWRANILIEAGAKIDEIGIDKNGNNIFHIIAGSGMNSSLNKSLMKKVFNSNAKGSINAKNSDGQSPLLKAFISNAYHLASKFIKYGSNIEDSGKDESGNTICHILAKDSVSYPMTSKLSNEVFKLSPLKLIMTKNNEGLTPLDIAIKTNNEEQTTLLIKAGAKINFEVFVDEDGNNLLHKIGDKTISNNELTELIVKTAPMEMLNAKNNDGLTPLDVAIKKNEQYKATLLIKAGAKINFEVFVDEDGNNLLHKIGDKTISNNELTELIVKTAPMEMLNAKNTKDLTPAEVALDQQNFTATILLVNAGSKIHFEKFKDEDDNNILHILSYRPFRDMDLIKLVVELVPSEIINAKNKDGKTPIDLILSNINVLCLDNIIFKSAKEKTMLNILFSREDITFDKNEALKNYIIKQICYKDNIIDKLPLIKVLAKNCFVESATEWVKLIAWDFISHDSELSVLDLVTILVKDNIIETASLEIPNNPPLQLPPEFLEYIEESKVESKKNEAKLREQEIFSYLRTAQDHLKFLNFTIPLNDNIDFDLLFNLLKIQVNAMSKSFLIELNKSIYQAYCETKTFDNLAEIFNTDKPLETKQKELLELQENFNCNDDVIFQILAGAELGEFKLATNPASWEDFKIYLDKTLDGIKTIKSMHAQMDQICHLGLYEYIIKLNFQNLDFQAYTDKVDKIFADGRDSKLKQNLVELLQILTKQENPFADQNNRYESEKKFMEVLRNKPIKVILEELKNADLGNIDSKDAMLIITIVDNIKIDLKYQSPGIQIDILNLPIFNAEFVIEDQEFVIEERNQKIEQNVISFDQQQKNEERIEREKEEEKEEEKEWITEQWHIIEEIEKKQDIMQTKLSGVLFKDDD